MATLAPRRRLASIQDEQSLSSQTPSAMPVGPGHERRRLATSIAPRYMASASDEMWGPSTILTSVQLASTHGTQHVSSRVKGKFSLPPKRENPMSRPSSGPCAAQPFRTLDSVAQLETSVSLSASEGARTYLEVGVTQSIWASARSDVGAIESYAFIQPDCSILDHRLDFLRSFSVPSFVRLSGEVINTMAQKKSFLHTLPSPPPIRLCPSMPPLLEIRPPHVMPHQAASPPANHIRYAQEVESRCFRAFGASFRRAS